MTKKNKAAAAPAAETTPAQPATPSTDGSATPAAPDQSLVTVNDLVTIVKFLEELATMKRLSEFEIQGVKPAFDRIVAFLNTHQNQLNTQNAADPVTQTEETLLDLPQGKGKKKSSKKK